MLGCELPRRGLEGARADRLPRPRAAALPRPHASPRTCASTPACTGSSDAAERIAELLDRGPDSRAGPTSWSATSRPAWLQRAAVCRAVLHEPELLLLDEPRSHLDPEAAALVEPLIGPAPGRTRVLVTHESRPALAEGDRVLALRARRLGRLRGPGDRRLGRRRAGDRTEGAERVSALPRRSSPRTCGSSCARCSRCRRWRCSRSPPSSSSASASTASRSRAASPPGCCWRRSCSPPSSRSTACSSPSASEGGFDAIRLAPVDGTALYAAKAAALVVYLAGARG